MVGVTTCPPLDIKEDRYVFLSPPATAHLPLWAVLRRDLIQGHVQPEHLKLVFHLKSDLTLRDYITLDKCDTVELLVLALMGESVFNLYFSIS